MGRIEQQSRIIRNGFFESNRLNFVERKAVERTAIILPPVVFNEVIRSHPNSCGVVSDRENPLGKKVTPILVRVGNIYVGMDPVRSSGSCNTIEFFNGEYPDYNGKQFVPVQGAAFESEAKSKYRPDDEYRFRNEKMFLFALGKEPSIEGKKK